MNLAPLTFVFDGSPDFEALLLKENPTHFPFNFLDIIDITMADLCLEATPDKRAAFISMLRTLAGPQQLGKINLSALQTFREDEQPTIFTQCHDRLEDVEPFILSFGKENCLIIKIGSAPNWRHPGIDIAWVPQMEPERQLRHLNKMLSTRLSEPTNEAPAASDGIAERGIDRALKIRARDTPSQSSGAENSCEQDEGA